jgi:two-component system, chemotaxis family, protein-glutamate methylesterase/glutaminase
VDDQSIARFRTKANLGALVAPAARVDVVVIGVSTGGPAALERVLPRLPRGLAVPVAVVQHMPAMFTRLLAERLAALGPLLVREAVDGALLAPGEVWIAVGGRHLALARTDAGVALRLDDGPAENSCRPAADVLFRTAAAAYGPGVLGVVLTGMGRDGVVGCEHIRDRGGAIVVQDRDSALVWGMPGAVAGAGLADAVVPLEDVAREIAARVERSRRT